jgi:hypothetical protein
VPRPSLALVFAGVKLDQKKVHAALCRELDPRILVGGSSYAEITPAGVSKNSVAVLLLDYPQAGFAFAGSRVRKDPVGAGERLAGALGPRPERRQLGLVLSGVGDGRDDRLLRALHAGLPGAAIFGGVPAGDHDAGMESPLFWKRWQYLGPRLEREAVSLAMIDLPADVRLGFGFEHGWSPVGPLVRVTKAKGARVHAVDGMRAVDYYRQFFGADASREVMLRSIQRFGFALRPEGETRGNTRMKLPVRMDFGRGWIEYYPPEDLEGRQVQLIAASRLGLIEGAREAARRALRALRGRKPSLVIAVSCCTRSSWLNSRIDLEMDAAREIFGKRTPIFGFYSSGELLPFLSSAEEASDAPLPFGGSFFHTTTVEIGRAHV